MCCIKVSASIADVGAEQKYFQFDQKYYKQTEGLAMGSPTSAILAETMSGMEVLDFSSMNLTFHLNCMPRICGSFKTTNSTAHAMFELECRFATEGPNPS
jgi:hypothetical protein